MASPVASHVFVETRNTTSRTHRSRTVHAAHCRISNRSGSRRTSDQRNSAHSFRPEPLTPFQLCVALIQTQRTHSQLIHELERVRELRRRGLVYREGIHGNRQFVEAYLDYQQEKINRTLQQLDVNQKRAVHLIAQADATQAKKATETSTAPATSAAAAPERFSARFRRHPVQGSNLPSGSDRFRSPVVSL